MQLEVAVLGCLVNSDLARAFSFLDLRLFWSSRWEVADSAASFFLAHFYAEVLNGNTMVEALDAAISELLWIMIMQIGQPGTKRLN